MRRRPARRVVRREELSVRRSSRRGMTGKSSPPRVAANLCGRWTAAPRRAGRLRSHPPRRHSVSLPAVGTHIAMRSVAIPTPGPLSRRREPNGRPAGAAAKTASPRCRDASRRRERRERRLRFFSRPETRLLPTPGPEPWDPNRPRARARRPSPRRVLHRDAHAPARGASARRPRGAPPRGSLRVSRFVRRRRFFRPRAPWSAGTSRARRASRRGRRARKGSTRTCPAPGSTSRPEATRCTARGAPLCRTKAQPKRRCP